LRNWLDANHDGPIDREGLLEIENHIDPTDFVAFNSFHNNLGKFASFARNTDEFSSGKIFWRSFSLFAVSSDL
jgi:hypothetical protein